MVIFGLSGCFVILEKGKTTSNNQFHDYFINEYNL